MLMLPATKSEFTLQLTKPHTHSRFLLGSLICCVATDKALKNCVRIFDSVLARYAQIGLIPIPSPPMQFIL